MKSGRVVRRVYHNASGLRTDEGPQVRHIRPPPVLFFHLPVRDIRTDVTGNFMEGLICRGEDNHMVPGREKGVHGEKNSLLSTGKDDTPIRTDITGKS